MLTAKQRAQMGEREEDVQRAIIQMLTYRGYSFFQTSVRLRAAVCSCGRKVSSPGKYGATPGIPDLFAFVNGYWRGMECKGPLTRVSSEQERLAAEGKIVICRTLDEAISAIERWEAEE